MIASAILWLLIPQQIQSLEKGMVTASTVPRIAIGGLFICALLLFVQGLRLPKKTIVLEKNMVSSPKFKKEFKSVIFGRCHTTVLQKQEMVVLWHWDCYGVADLSGIFTGT